MEHLLARLSRYLSMWRRAFSTSIRELLCCFPIPRPSPSPSPSDTPESNEKPTAVAPSSVSPRSSTSTLSPGHLLPCELDPIDMIGRMQAPRVTDTIVRWSTLSLADAQRKEIETRQLRLTKEADHEWLESIKANGEVPPDHLIVIEIRYREAVSWRDDGQRGSLLPVVQVVLKTRCKKPKRSQTLLRETFFQFRDILVRDRLRYGLDVVHEALAGGIMSNECGE